MLENDAFISVIVNIIQRWRFLKRHWKLKSNMALCKSVIIDQNI